MLCQQNPFPDGNLRVLTVVEANYLVPWIVLEKAPEERKDPRGSMHSLLLLRIGIYRSTRYTWYGGTQVRAPVDWLSSCVPLFVGVSLRQKIRHGTA